MFLFGLKMLYEAWKMKPDEAAELENEVREELERRGSIASSIRSCDPERDNADSAGNAAQQLEPLQQQQQQQEDQEESSASSPPRPKIVKRVQIREKSLFGKT